MADASVRVTRRGPLDIVQVAAFGDVPDTPERLSKHFGVAVTPAPNRAVIAGGLAILWNGPSQWLIVRPPGGTPLADELASLFGEAAAVVDFGHARTVLRFEGEGVRDLLANGTSIDLRPAHFTPGSCALTTLGKIGALLHAVADSTIDVYVPRTYSQAFIEWLDHAAPEAELVRAEQ
jgi:heterotetrameric sarcosine oxidase gamma subunit